MNKTQTNKDLLITQFKQTPIVEVACQKVAVARATYYRWRNEDPEFSKAADAALADGTAFVCDAAESQLISAIKAGNLTAIIFWLKYKHPDYKQKMFQSGLAIAQDDQENLYFEAFGQLKPETQKLVEPYLDIINKNNGEQRKI